MLQKYLFLALFVLICTSQLVQPKPSPQSKVTESFDDAYEDLPNDEGSEEDDEYEDYGSNTGSSDTLSGGTLKDAKIISTPKHLTVLEGDKVEFDCLTDQGDFLVTQWFHDDKLLYQDDLFGLGSELKKHYNKSESGSLFIYNITANDAGNYSCRVMVKKGHLDITHHLNVKQPAKIVRILPNDNFVAREKEPLNLVCEASGVPPPKVTWAKSGERFPELSGQYNVSTYSFSEIHSRDAGIYQCMADNKVGDPVIKQITIRVEHKPHVVIEKSTISSEKDYTSVLTCTSHANPAAITEWFKNGQRIMPDGRKYNITERGHEHTLFVLNTQVSDFGKYTCESKNHIGVTKKDVMLTGVPVPITLQVQSNGATPIYKWSFQSVAPITMYDLQYKKFDDKHYIAILNDIEIQNPIGAIYNSKYDSKEVLSDAAYQSRIRAKNTYGWSEFSDIVSFTINRNEPVPENISKSSATSIASQFSIVSALLLITLNRLYQ